MYGEYIKFDFGRSGGQADYILSINAVVQGDSSVLNAVMKHRSGEESFAITGGVQPEQAYALATEAFARTVLPGIPAMLLPTSVAVRPNGKLLAGFSLLCVEFDPAFRIIDQPGKSLYESGNYNYAAGISVTPGGTIFFKPTTGRDLYRLVEGMSRPQKLRAGVDLFGPFTTLPDGSAVIIDLQQKKAYRVTKEKRQSLELFTGPYSYISAIAVGPEGNIWVYDIAERRVRIHNPCLCTGMAALFYFPREFYSASTGGECRSGK